MDEWKMKVMRLVAELIETFPEPERAPLSQVEPISLTEIEGGSRFDGDFMLVGECGRCGSQVSHIITEDMLNAPNSADVYARIAHCACEGSYELPRPLRGSLFDRGKPYYLNPDVAPNLGLFGPVFNPEVN